MNKIKEYIWNHHESISTLFMILFSLFFFACSIFSGIMFSYFLENGSPICFLFMLLIVINIALIFLPVMQNNGLDRRFILPKPGTILYRQHEKEMSKELEQQNIFIVLSIDRKKDKIIVAHEKSSRFLSEKQIITEYDMSWFFDDNWVYKIGYDKDIHEIVKTRKDLLY